MREVKGLWGRFWACLSMVAIGAFALGLECCGGVRSAWVIFDVVAIGLFAALLAVLFYDLQEIECKK